jgi:hypothetical protein
MVGLTESQQKDLIDGRQVDQGFAGGPHMVESGPTNEGDQYMVKSDR